MGDQVGLLGSDPGRWGPWLGTVCVGKGLQASAHQALVTWGRKTWWVTAPGAPRPQLLSVRKPSSVRPERGPKVVRPPSRDPSGEALLASQPQPFSLSQGDGCQHLLAARDPHCLQPRHRGDQLAVGSGLTPSQDASHLLS